MRCILVAQVEQFSFAKPGHCQLILPILVLFPTVLVFSSMLKITFMTEAAAIMSHDLSVSGEGCTEDRSYAIEVINQPSETIKEYAVKENGAVLTYEKVLTLLKTCSRFRSCFIDFFKSIAHEAYFWETIPITVDQWQHEPFQFVIVPTSALARVSPDRDTFKDHFQKSKNRDIKVISFPSLGKDALLIVPRPNDQANYAHLAAFVKNAPTNHQEELWMHIGIEMPKAIQEAKGKKKWLSTSGLGVYWLHVRIDSRPKYYTYPPYKV